MLTTSGQRADPQFGAIRAPSKPIGMVCLWLSSLVFISLAGLIPLGQWKDEYDYISVIRARGAPFFLRRLLHWSARPLSEALGFLYAELVSWFGSPLIELALVPMWVLFFASVLLPSLIMKRGLLLSAVLGCLLLIGHKVAEVFYWPMGAFAYVPTLSAAVLILTLDIAAVERATARTWTMIALLVAAGSSEVGAVFSVLYCVCAGSVAVFARDRSGWPLLAPLLTSILVLWLTSTGRVAMNVEMVGDPSIIHHAGRALGATLRTMFHGPDDPTVYETASSLVSKLLLLAGVYCLSSAMCRPARPLQQKRRLALVAALLGTAFAARAAAFYQFGLACCERHQTVNECYTLTAIAAFGLWLATWWPFPRRGLGEIVLLASLLAPLTQTAPAILSDYRHSRRSLQARWQTWTSADQSSPVVTVTQASGKIVGSSDVPAGHYELADPKVNRSARQVIVFFRKEAADFRNAADR